MTATEFIAGKAEIDAMSHLEMARLYRFAKVGHPYFVPGPLNDLFYAKWESLGGMTPEISKEIGWQEPP